MPEKKTATAGSTAEMLAAATTGSSETKPARAPRKSSTGTKAATGTGKTTSKTTTSKTTASRPPSSRSRSTAGKATASQAVAKPAATESANGEPAAMTGSAMMVEVRVEQISPEQRETWVREAAYFRSERRGPVSDPIADWVEAEREIDALLNGRVDQ